MQDLQKQVRPLSILDKINRLKLENTTQVQLWDGRGPSLAFELQYHTFLLGNLNFNLCVGQPAVAATCMQQEDWKDLYEHDQLLAQMRAGRLLQVRAYLI